MSAVSFLLDENIPLAIQAQLEQMEPTASVYTIGDGIAPPKATPDPDILSWIEVHDCMLITNNRRTIPVHLYAHLARGQHVPGIIQLPRRMNIGAILEDLWLIWTSSEPGEFRDQIVHLPLQR